MANRRYALVNSTSSDSSVVHIAGTETITGDKTFAADLNVTAPVTSTANSVRKSAGFQVDSDTHAGIYLQAGGAPSEEGNWDISALSTGRFRISTSTDADGSAIEAFTIERTGTAIDSINLLTTGAVNITGDLNVSGDIDTTIAGSVTARAVSSGTTNALNLVSGTPGMWIFEDDAPASEGGWKMYASAGALNLYTTTDAGGSVDHVWNISRTGTTLNNLTSYLKNIIEGHGEMILLKDTSAGAAAQSYIAFDDSASVRQGYIGFGSGSNQDLYVYCDLGDLRYNAGSGDHYFTGGTLNVDSNINIDGTGGGLRVWGGTSSAFIELHGDSASYIDFSLDGTGATDYAARLRYYDDYLSVESADLQVNQNLYVVGTINRTVHSEGYLEGGYNNIGNNNSKTNPIFSIGSVYVPTATTFSNMYGIGFCYGSLDTLATAFTVSPGNQWGLYGVSNGNPGFFLSANDGQAFFKSNVYTTGINVAGTQNLKIGNSTNQVHFPNTSVVVTPSSATLGADVLHYSPWVAGGAYDSSSSSETGYARIRFPAGSLSDSIMGTIEIHGYNYSAHSGDGGAWGIVIGGYWYSTENWNNADVQVLYGTPPFDRVQLGEATSYKYILLGISTTNWNWPKIQVRSVVAGYASQNWGANLWNIDISASTPTGWAVDATDGLFYIGGSIRWDRDQASSFNIGGALTISTSAASGGNNGDIHFKYT